MNRRRLLVLLPALLLLSGARPVADANFNGTWRITALQPDKELILGLIAVETRGGNLQARVVAATLMEPRDLLIQRIAAAGNQLRIDLEVNKQTIRLVAYAGKAETRPTRLLGSLEVRGKRDLLRLDRTDARDVDPARAATPSPALEDMGKAMALAEPKEREAALKRLLERFANQTGTALPLALELLELANETEVGESELKARADQAVKIAATHGREMEMQVAQITAQIVLKGGKHPEVGLALARQAEELLDQQDTLATQSRILRTLIQARRAAKEIEGLAELEARLAPIDKQLDEEYEANLVPFPVQRFTRPAAANRVAVVEMFNATQRPASAAADPAVTADVVFAALKGTYNPQEVILLQHHLHIPESNPLANPDTEMRALWYGINFVPAVFLDGKAQATLGATTTEARGDYALLREAINKQLATSSDIKLDLAARRAGDVVKITARAAGLPGGESKQRLWVMLVEERVHYVGTNGNRLHDGVVRAIPKLADDVVHGQSSEPIEISIDLAELRTRLQAYLDDTAKSDPFPDNERPLVLEKLRVVLLVQNEETKAILQAVTAEVEAEPK
ncbi:MAG TPA: hypothetical protein PKD86_13480 [Gemmatales bacterium]|nr:hypothetical protein [Gemmatales bacterium]HMP60353.1 hypothetical protein [Gemmatales bacterium]